MMPSGSEIISVYIASAVVSDMYNRKITNGMHLFFLFLLLTYGAIYLQLFYFISTIAMFFAFYKAKVFGASDVKMLAVLSAYYGPMVVILIAGIALIVNAVVALLFEFMYRVSYYGLFYAIRSSSNLIKIENGKEIYFQHMPFAPFIASGVYIYNVLF